EGVAGAVLLRAGEVLSDPGVAHSRRPTARSTADLARGPARLAALLGLDRTRNGVDLTDRASPVRLIRGDPVSPHLISTGPRVGIAVAVDTPWRFWITDSPAVSAYRLGGKRQRKAG